LPVSVIKVNGDCFQQFISCIKYISNLDWCYHSLRIIWVSRGIPMVQWLEHCTANLQVVGSDLAGFVSLDRNPLAMYSRCDQHWSLKNSWVSYVTKIGRGVFQSNLLLTFVGFSKYFYLMTSEIIHYIKMSFRSILNTGTCNVTNFYSILLPL